MIPSSVRIYVCVLPQDMRRSFDGLALAAQQVLGKEPKSGAVFCFINKRGNRLKVLWWDRNGYCMLYKRGDEAKFVLPDQPRGELALQIDAAGLRKLVTGVPRQTRRKRA